MLNFSLYDSKFDIKDYLYKKVYCSMERIERKSHEKKLFR